MNYKTIIGEVKTAIRSPYTFPGGYPVYTVLSDGEMLCHKCARENFRLIAQATRDDSDCGWRAIGAEIYFEGPDEYCAHCNKPLESAYTDSSEEDENEN